MLRPLTIESEPIGEVQQQDRLNQYGLHHKRTATARRRKQARTSEEPVTSEADLVEVEPAQMGRLLEEYVPQDMEPRDLESGTMSPVEQRLRSRSGHPHVVSVPDDIHSSVLQAGGKQALLTPCQEIILARRIEKGDRRAKDALINSNLRLVTSIAQRYQGRGVPMEDLMQEGIVGLIRAADKYNWRRGFRFSTYATHWIRQTILRAIANTGRSIRLPAYVVDLLGKLTRVRSELESAMGRSPSRAELAQAVGITEERLLEVLQSAADPVSLDSPLGDEDNSRSLAEIVPAEESQGPSARVFRRAIQEEIGHALKSLTPREQDVLKLRFGLEGQEPHTLEEVGKALHITRERARQLEVQSLQKLRGNRAGDRLRETLDAE